MKKPLDPPLDYEAVGLICGLEVHQQLLTQRKLFCHCPAGLYSKGHDGTVLRHMRPTLSELGVYDGTALMEFKTKKEIVYLLNRSNVCTYEMDDTPPFLVNQEAIDTAIELCLMMRMDIIDEIHIARKQYLDGIDPDRLPAHGDRRRQRLAAVPRPPPHGHPRQRRGGLLPRGLRPRPPDRLAHRPAGNAAHRDGDRRGAPHPGGGARRHPALRHDGPVDPARAHGHRRQPPGRQRQGARRRPGGDQGRAAGRLRGEAGPQRGRAPGQPAAAARRAAPPRAARGRDSMRVDPVDVSTICARGLELRVHARALEPAAGSSRCGSTGPARHAGAAPDAARHHLPRRARRPHPRHRRASTSRRSSWTARRWPNSPTGTACSSALRKRLQLAPGDDVLRRLRVRRTTAARPPRRSACASPTPRRACRARRARRSPAASPTFERILPGPDRMYPDTDSPPTPRHRASASPESARAALPRRPGSGWSATARCAGARGDDRTS